MLFRGIRGHKILWSKYRDAECRASEQRAVLCDTRGLVWHLSSGHQIITGLLHTQTPHSAASPSLSDLSDIYLFVWCQLCAARCMLREAQAAERAVHPVSGARTWAVWNGQTRLSFVLKLLSHQAYRSAFIQFPRFTLFIPEQECNLNGSILGCELQKKIWPWSPDTQSWLVMTILKQSSEIARTLGSHEQLR